jgi:predicted deacetylase
MKPWLMYLIRFDDICPAMNWTIWTKIDEILTAEGIKPILAIIPHVRNSVLFIEKEKLDFWDYVREKQKQGWSIGLHGYQHVYVTKCSGILGLNPFSEFAGLPEEEQEAKISSAVEIFRANGVKPELWIAPAHSFDEVTIRVLKRYDITIISDGFSLYPYVDDGMLWIPQQLWGFPKIRMPFGVYTILFHHNLWKKKDLMAFKENIKIYRKNITDLKTVISLYSSRKKSLIDDLYEIFNYLIISRYNRHVSVKLINLIKKRARSIHF